MRQRRGERERRAIAVLRDRGRELGDEGDLAHRVVVLFGGGELERRGGDGHGPFGPVAIGHAQAQHVRAGGRETRAEELGSQHYP